MLRRSRSGREEHANLDSVGQEEEAKAYDGAGILGPAKGSVPGQSLDESPNALLGPRSRHLGRGGCGGSPGKLGGVNDQIR